VALAGLATLAACGGSVSRVEVFVPTAFVSFGDELSYLESDGRKYSVNIFATVTNADGTVSNTTALNCAVAPVWNQALAASFKFEFAQCNPNPTTTRPADLRSAPNATVAQVVAQVAAYRNEAGKSFTPKTLATVMAGLHDVLDAYTLTYKAGGRTEAKRQEALAIVTAAGKQLGDLVNAVTDSGRGARVIYSSIPDLQYSPLAVADEAAAPGSLAVLRDLSAAFNTSFRITVLDDGRYAGVVLGDELMQILGKFGGFALPAVSPCTTALPNCTPSTLTDATPTTVPPVDGSATAHLWADATRPGVTWHNRVATSADSRARNNPF
jgi:hypothetical protein